jgi:glycosyltransferase involved in cell wall biosynthesis
VNAEFVPSRGSGQAVYAEQVAFGLSAEHDVTVVTSRPPGSSIVETIAGVRVVRVPVPSWDASRWLAFGYKAPGAVRSLYQRQPFDAVHFLDAHVGYRYRGRFTASLMQSFRQRLRGNGGLPYHSTVSNLAQRFVYYRAARRMERRAVAAASRLVAISKATRDEFVGHYDVDPSRIEVVYPGVDTERFRPVPTTALRERLALGEKRILLYVGFSTARKGLETLARALGRVRETRSVLLIVGRWEKGYRDKFYRHLAVPRERVVEAGYVDDHELPAYYALADVFVLPSVLEGFGLPLAESLACRTPVIGTTAGSIPEVVGDCGLTVPPRDSDALAKAIDRMLADSELSQGIRDRCRERVESEFSLGGMQEKMSRFFRNQVAP